MKFISHTLFILKLIQFLPWSRMTHQKEMEPIKLQDLQPSCETDFNTLNSELKTGISSVKETNVLHNASSQMTVKVQEVIFIKINVTSVQLELNSKPEFVDPAVETIKYGL